MSNERNFVNEIPTDSVLLTHFDGHQLDFDYFVSVSHEAVYKKENGIYRVLKITNGELSLTFLGSKQRHHIKINDVISQASSASYNNNHFGEEYAEEEEQAKEGGQAKEGEQAKEEKINIEQCSAAVSDNGIINIDILIPIGGRKYLCHMTLKIDNLPV